MHVCTSAFEKTHSQGDEHMKTNIGEHKSHSCLKSASPGLVLNNRMKFTHGKNEIYPVILRHTLWGILLIKMASWKYFLTIEILVP